MDERVGMDHLKRTQTATPSRYRRTVMRQLTRLPVAGACRPHRGVLCGLEIPVVTLASLPAGGIISSAGSMSAISAFYLLGKTSFASSSATNGYSWVHPAWFSP